VTPDPKSGSETRGTAATDGSTKDNGGSNTSTRTSNDDYANQVWGLVYNLSPEDEAQLDINEGVPYAYEKRILEAEFWPAVGRKSSTRLWARRTRSKCQKKTLLPVLVYIDFQRADDHDHDHEGQQHLPGNEYVYQMNRGIKDALREGVPEGYVEKVLRRYIPPREEEEDEVEVEVDDMETKGAWNLKQVRGRAGRLLRRVKVALLRAVSCGSTTRRGWRCMAWGCGREPERAQRDGDSSW
jgi:hypothetical protein